VAADVDTQAVEDTYREAPKALADIADWSSSKLLRKSVSCSPRLRLSIRFGDADGEGETPIKPAHVLDPRCAGGTCGDLWIAFAVTAR